MQRSALSARAAAAYLGFASANPVLDAIRVGELPAERRPGVSRNGANRHSYLIPVAELDAFAARHGLELPSRPAPAEAPVEAPTEGADEREPIRLPLPSPAAPVAPAAPGVPAVGLVTIPVEHYAALVAARGELEFIRANFELTWRGASPAQTVKLVSPEFGGEADARSSASSARTRAPRRGRASK